MIKIFAAIGILAFISCGCAHLKTEWVGKFAYAGGDESFYKVGLDRNIDVGLRSDGVMVWRKKQ